MNEIKNIKAVKIGKLLISIIICFSAAIIGSYFTIPEIKTWYVGIEKPSWNPPNSLFGPVWTTLYALMSVSLWLVWTKAEKNAKAAFIVFFIQLILNALWSIIFFKFHNILLAFIEILLLFIFIILTIILFSKVSKLASALLFPYLFWVGFALYLNYTIYKLN